MLNFFLRLEGNKNILLILENKTSIFHIKLYDFFTFIKIIYFREFRGICIL